MASTDSPPAKVRRRVYEACDRCRVKKVGCSGQKPVCSLCARLGQDCNWSGRWKTLVPESTNPVSDLSTAYQFVPSSDDHESDASLENRVIALDEKVTEVLDQVRLLAGSQPQPSNGLDAAPIPVDSSWKTQAPDVNVVQEAATLYLQFCHCQPLPLFDPHRFVATVTSRPIELQLCIAGYALRFNNTWTQRRPSLHSIFLGPAQNFVMNKVASGKIELSTLQSLCLLSLCEFNDDKRQQSAVHLTLARELASMARLDLCSQEKSSGSAGDEHNRCLWSLILLQYLSGSFGPMTVAIDTKSIRYPSSTSTNRLASTGRQSNSNLQLSTTDLGVEAYAIQMTEVWHEARRWIYQRGKQDTQPPWSGQSQYHQIMLRQMELESLLPYKHRFKPSGFSDHEISDLSTNRSYWAPWLYLQIIYHATVCAINHPLLLSMYIRHFRVNQIPELFLQQTADLISAHTDWIIHLLQVANDRQFQFSDPFIGQCIAIVATIFLQQSYTENVDKRTEKRAKFSTCINFLKELGNYWPLVQDLATNLQKFESKLSRAYESSIAQHSPNLTNRIDLTLLWMILDNTQPKIITQLSDTMFGSSLRFNNAPTSSSELLNANPIPEPTRVDSLSRGHMSSTSTPAQSTDVRVYDTSQQGTLTAFTPVPSLYPALDAPFSTQNFFALGQDFVGNVDDWFTWTEQ